MSEPENFLSRWSRRKRGAEQEPSARPGEPPTHKASAGRPQSAEASAKAESGDPGSHKQTAEPPALDSRLRGNKRRAGFDATETASGEARKEEPQFDLSTLPSLESITAETDVRAFLQKGVPADLTRAALRRAWTADPNIRDFIEIAENQWDFATGSDLPGFGALGASPEDIRRMVADVFGDGPKPAAEPDEAQVASDKPSDNAPSEPAKPAPEPPAGQDIAAGPEELPPPESAPAEPGEGMMQCNKVDIALQHNNQDSEYRPPPTRRPHGRALPQ